MLVLGTSFATSTSRISRSRGAGLGERGVLGNLADSLQYVRSRRRLLGVALARILLNLLPIPYAQMVPVMARGMLRVDAWLLSANAIAAIALLAMVAVFARPLLRWILSEVCE